MRPRLQGWPVVDDGQLVGCDKQRAGTPIRWSGVPALRLSHPTDSDAGQPWTVTLSHISY